MKDFINELRAKMAANSGVIHISEDDELRLATKCHQAAVQSGYNFFVWTQTDGLRPASDNIEMDGRDRKQLEAIVDPVNGLLRTVKNWEYGPSVVLAYDALTMINRMPTLPIACRLIKDITDKQQQVEADQDGNETGVVQLILCDRETLQLETPVQRMQLELPDRAEMGKILEAVLQAVDPQAAEDARSNTDRILNSLMGLPAYQAANAISESVVRTGKVDPSLLKEYKKEMVQAKGITWIDPDPRGFDAIGGLTPLKEWFNQIRPAFNPDVAAEYNLDPPKGVVVAGAPGCGKSALVRGLGGVWNEMPILRLDVGATRGKFQGDSELGWEAAISACEAAAPAILWLDELEKGFEGAASSGETDGGTGARVLQSFLTWLQDRNKDTTRSVFVYATANRPQRLPPEMLRAGRFDAQFWVDFPGTTERAGIIDVYCQRYSKLVNVDKDALLQASQDCSGAEIEASFREAALKAMAAGRPTATDDIVTALQNVPRAKNTFKVEGDLKAWKDAALSANDPEEASPTSSTKIRRIRPLK